jgi:hypothetical protein
MSNEKFYKTHDWSEESFDWVGLNNAITYLCDTLYDWGRFTVSAKEKWGQARVSVYFWDGNPFGWFFYSSKNPILQWLYWNVGFKICIPLVKKTKILWLVHQYQIAVYRYAYRQVLKKFPHLVGEILGGCDQIELLKDYLLEHKLETPFKSERCWKGQHDYTDKNYCKDCFRIYVPTKIQISRQG